MEYKHKYTRLAYAYITYAVAIICGFVLFSSCSNDDAAQRDGIVRIGIAWRADMTSTSYVSTIKAIREAECEPVLLPRTERDGY